MRFDAVIGNPPYQGMTGGGGLIKHATSLYNIFYMQGIDKIDDRGRVCMIIPSRWLSGGGIDIQKFRGYIAECKHIECIYNFEKSNEIFSDVSIAGGVCFLVFNNEETFDKTKIITARNKDNTIEIIDEHYIDLSKYKTEDNDYVIIKRTLEEHIIDKVLDKAREIEISFIGNRIFKGIPYGLETNYIGKDSLTDKYNIKVVCSNGRETYISRDEIQKDIESINSYKVIINRLNTDRGGVNSKETWNVTTEPKVLKSGEIFTNTFTGIVDCKSLDEAIRLKSYLKTKFIRFLIQVTITGVHITGNNFRFVPDLYNDIDIDDDTLYKYFQLSNEEINLIEERIKEM